MAKLSQHRQSEKRGSTPRRAGSLGAQSRIKEMCGPGLGHNAHPIAKGQCCDVCQDTKVLPLRLDLMLNESPAFQMFSRLVQDLGGSHE